LRLIILDACRVNPFKDRIHHGLRGSGDRGLAPPPESDPGTLVVYSAKDGEVAADDVDGFNSPFAQAFIKELKVPGREVRRLFDYVRDDVIDATRNRQEPFTYGSLPGRRDFFFISPIGLMQFEDRGSGKDDAEAVRLYRKAADAGDASAMRNLGWMYENGQGVAKDYGEAMRWYRKAADAGDALGMSVLGSAYADGLGVAKDVAEAVRWYRKAADAGDARAQYTLGFMYEYGRGVARDYRQAREWYEKAAAAGDHAAQAGLDRLKNFER
jgi:hypothetical protein